MLASQIPKKWKKIFHAEGPSFILGIILTDRDYKSMPIKLHNRAQYEGVFLFFLAIYQEILASNKCQTDSLYGR